MTFVLTLEIDKLQNVDKKVKRDTCSMILIEQVSLLCFLFYKVGVWNILNYFKE